ncbi:Hypothetical protein FKW44_014471 [Caligus rogercresseyi]|uniref:Uncharacterized protein n=1 Tax=Caligus rogercresseyi TaxID=217165 RepID=A0A7T8GYY0_CALRO|nr:Hypothetical protein FKW44_014471 [Caligus rogercresseyi]
MDIDFQIAAFRDETRRVRRTPSFACWGRAMPERLPLLDVRVQEERVGGGS